jgi:hypothetical protein
MGKYSPNFSTRNLRHGCRAGNLKVDRTMTNSFLPPYEVDLKRDYDIISSYDAPPPFLRSSQYFSSSEEIEGQLPELAINAIYNHFGKPGPVRMMVEMTDSKILLDYVADF